MSADADRASRFHILFVCTGNLCRSVMAERLTRHGLAARLGAGAAAFQVASAGTSGLNGSPMHPYTAHALCGLGADVNGFASRGLIPAAIDDADLILCASRDHRDEAVVMRPTASRRAYLFREFTRLAAYASPSAAGEAAVDRARRVVAEAARLRGRVPYVEPAADEIEDPAETHEAFMACAASIEPLTRQLLDALCGSRSGSQAHQPTVVPRPPAGLSGSPPSPVAGSMPVAAGRDQPGPTGKPNGLRRITLAHVRLGAAEERAVLEVLRSGKLTGGARVAEFEGAFAAAHGAAHAVAVSNGTVALVAALRAHGIGPGDEVITTPFTFAATLNAILEVGATARFADIGEDLAIGPGAIAALVTSRTRAVVPVHLYGLPADMPAICGVAARYGLAIIEDAAQAHGARVGADPVGCSGTAAFSLYGTKNITCGEGGVVTTGDDKIADSLRLLRNHGMREHYQYELPGHNYRLTDMQAAIATVQVSKLASVNARRARNAALLSAGLADVPGLRLPAVPPDRQHAWHQYTVRLTAAARMDRDRLRSRLSVAGIDARPYYPRLVHDYQCYHDHPRVIRDTTPQARLAAAEVLSLPVHPGLTGSDIDRIIGCVRAALTGGRGSAVVPPNDDPVHREL